MLGHSDSRRTSVRGLVQWSWRSRWRISVALPEVDGSGNSDSKLSIDLVCLVSLTTMCPLLMLTC